MNPPTSSLSQTQQENLMDTLQVFKIQGRDKRGNKILRIIGKFFPARIVSSEALKKYLEEKIFTKLEDKPFSVVYVHTEIQRSENCPGISTLRSIYEAIPINVKNQLQAVYFVHPGIQARFFLATFGWFLFSAGLYSKMKYVNRVEFLWEHVRRNEMEIPEFVYEHEEAMEDRPITVDYGLESDHPRLSSCGAVFDNPVSSYSMRCIA